MSGWAWFLVISLLIEITGTPLMVGRQRTPITPPSAAVIVGVQMLKLYAVLSLAGAL